jgi:LCP family protein required for cell wall assembly
MTNLFDEQEFEEFTDANQAPGATVKSKTSRLGRFRRKPQFALDFDVDGTEGISADAISTDPPGGLGSIGIVKPRRTGGRALKAFGGLGLAFLVLVGGITGWGYLKFRAIPKIKVESDAFGRVGRETDATIAYDDSFDTETTEPNSSLVITNTVPLTAPTIAPSVPPSKQPKPETVPGTDTSDSSDTSGSSEAVTGTVSTLVPEGAELLPVDTTPVTIDPVTADALAEADAQDAAEVRDLKKPKAPTSTTIPVVFEAVGPGPIVKAAGVEPFGGPGTKNYLMIGVDDRKVIDASQAEGFGVGQVGGSRTDTILILRIDTANHKAWILSIPRDLWVPLATSGRPARINSAFVKGPTELLKTIQQRLSIPIDHIVQVDFAGFQKVVSTVGGVEVCFSNPTRDLKSSLSRREPGCQILDANGATAYVRSRHYQQLVNGVWKEDPRSDLGRIIRQQSFIRSVMTRALAQSTNPLTVNAMLDDLKHAVAIDSSFSFPETTALANDLRSFDPNSLEAFTLPTVGARVNGAAVLKLNTKAAAKLIGKFQGK